MNSCYNQRFLYSRRFLNRWCLHSYSNTVIRKKYLIPKIFNPNLKEAYKFVN